MPSLPTASPTDIIRRCLTFDGFTDRYYPSVLHRELQQNYKPCYNYRRKSRRELPLTLPTENPSVIFPRGIFFGAHVSVCITVGVWVFLFATELATEMGFTDDCYTDGSLPSVLFSPTDFISITDGINPSVKLDNVVVIAL